MMRIFLNALLGAALTGITTSLPEPIASFDINSFAADNIITRDVAIIGGGGSGGYAAIRLKDMGKSVAVVDQRHILGGHTETYKDPVTGGTTEVGVVAWYDEPLVRNFFARLNVSVTAASFSSPGLTTIPLDFRTDKVLTSVYSGNATEGLANYIAQIEKYVYLEEGFYLPDPVPEDLLIPFGDFVKKYNIEGAVPTILIFGNGIGNLLSQPTLYVFKLVSLATVQRLSSGLVTTAKHDNQELYDNIATELGDSVFLSSNVLAVDRSGSCVKIVIKTPSGLKCIEAKKLLVTVAPKVDNLQWLGLSAEEFSIFSQFINAGYYPAILNNTGIPDNIEVRNFGIDTPYNVPALPGPYFISPSGIPGLFNFKYASPYTLPDDYVKAAMVAAVTGLKTAGILNTTTPDFVLYSSHTPFELTVSIDAIKSGFYKKLYALQGKNKTYWTGAAFHAHDSSKLWEFTERLLPSIVDGL